MCDCNSSCVPVGPRGIAGPEGPQGEQGEQGPAGADGGPKFTAFTSGVIDHTWAVGESVIPTTTQTIATSGNYQVHMTLNSDCDFAGLGSSACVVRLYIGGALADSVTISSVDALATPMTGTMKQVTMLWRGAITAGQDVELRGFLSPGNTVVSIHTSVLINEE